ncbi:hypothetical protein DPMN_140110 [Dreissena polymorpha]|uniref:Uncharacterized protein n=1 Tax=Dreissena polymorpha TaxID=45954 RepID=A0A9D4GAX1_DREPO|nr:hypothetical protein DPMN_140110 [Dreissena polymorpha]
MGQTNTRIKQQTNRQGKNTPHPSGNVFQPKNIIFELFNEDWTINVASKMKNALPLGSHVFQAKFHEDRKINVASREKCPTPWRPYIIRMNLLTKFHEDQTIHVASRVNKGQNSCFFPSENLVKNAPPLGSDVFQAKTNFLTKFNEDWTINVASRVLAK